ncbi:FoP domain-containing protein, putative [Plasmodium chabaudi chabaudi]|uniref:FoP domain-containing protein, putative n=1 Tax=Plasmodium chabaudi chabaudi TaxID=31271 RepID=A0A4V0KAB1_PLACU|nr:FoP domain-containing protein, putative [Plasmodium chabaudi chabaudi]VTZ69822.1 FoP domain-containing protein, putative [Plasmodium chabaudi chabaudi]|eukprot:XP_016654326.1 conserved Plasmodium protein, unknown function [Plasmodium chabaudi chabaudi]
MAKIDRKDKIGRKKDGISKSRKAGFTKFSYQQNRGKSFKFAQKKTLDVRKHIFKPYGRGNLSMMNRKNFKKGNNSFFFKNKRKIGNKFHGRSFGNTGREAFLKKSRGNNFRKGRHAFKSGKKRTVFFKKTQNLHDKIGKLTSKELDDELDNYMGSSNVKTRLDNDLDSYFKNNGNLQADMNEGFNKMGE